MAPIFTLEEATPADLESIYEIGESVYEGGPARALVYPPHLAHLSSKEEFKTWRTGRLSKVLEDKKKRHFKVVARDQDSDTELVAGYALWVQPTTEDTSDPQEDKEDKEEGFLPASMDVECFNEQEEAIKKMKERIWGKDSSYWYLIALAVSPKFQRKGVGRMLVNWGLDTAGKDGLPIYLEATPEGKPLYRSAGFDTVEELNLRGYIVTAMKWTPAT